MSRPEGACARAVAINEGEFGNQDFARIDDESLIKAYKLRMQIFYLTLPLASPSDEEAALFFPPEIKVVLGRKPPDDSQGFHAYVSQLERDVISFRSHLERLMVNYSSVAERIRKFKSEAVTARFEPPDDYKVGPRHGYSGAGVLGKNEVYYEINGFIVASDQGKMRIVGLRFFNRLF
jgi:hypothetical protein